MLPPHICLFCLSPPHPPPSPVVHPSHRPSVGKTHLFGGHRTPPCRLPGPVAQNPHPRAYAASSGHLPCAVVPVTSAGAAGRGRRAATRWAARCPLQLSALEVLEAAGCAGQPGVTGLRCPPGATAAGPPGPPPQSSGVCWQLGFQMNNTHRPGLERQLIIRGQLSKYFYNTCLIG